MKKRFIPGRLCLLIAIVVMTCVCVLAQSSSFTYQGRLDVGGGPANSPYDMQFKLFDAESAGGQVGTTRTEMNVQTSAGIFTVHLDFGTAAFSGADRWLEISISPAGQNNFTTLAPRQRLGSAPYSVKALSAIDSQSLGGIAASEYVQTSDGRLTDDRNPLPGSSHYLQNTSTQQPGANFNIGGTGAANVLDAGTQFNLGGQRFISALANGNLFIGNGTGSGITTGEQNTFVGLSAGAANTFGSGNSFFGTNAGGQSNGHLNSFFGVFSGDSNSGTQNSFFGGYTGFVNAGSFNAFFGYGAGFNNTAGNENSFFGNSSGITNTTGNRNAFYGFESGRQSRIGNDNSFFGSRAGGNNDIGSTNTFVGSFAGRLSNTGDANSFVGASAGFNNMSGSSNLFIGASAGIANSIGGRNTILGTLANLGANNLTNAGAIGYGALVTQSNSLVLGGISGFNSGTDTNVGIGTTAPLARLHVNRIDEGIRLQGRAVSNNNQAYMTFYDSAGSRIGYVGDGSSNDRGVYLISDNDDVVLSSGFGRVLTASFTGSILMRGGPNILGPTADTYAAQTIETGNFKGLYTPNLFLSSLDTFLPSALDICARIVGIGTGAGGYALTRCTTSFSSVKDKTDVQPFSEGLSIVRRLDPVSFRWRNGGHAVGLNTEDVAAVAPQLVTRNEKGEIESVSEKSLDLLFINAFKELEKQIEALARQIGNQQKQIEALKELVCTVNQQADPCKEKE